MVEIANSSSGAGETTMLSVAREGFIGGMIGAAALAIWFLVSDTLAGRPLYTPAMLGARIFRGITPSELTGLPESAAALIAGYSVVHGVAFVIAGLMIASAMAVFERTPPLLIPGFFFLVVFFELCYYVFVLAFIEPVFGALNWPAVLIGNLLAAATMGIYFLRRHHTLLPRLVKGEG